MQLALYGCILLLGLASYITGLRHIVQGKYAPSIFSRVVWLLLAIVSFAGVVGSKGSGASVFLAGIFLVGNAAICLASFWKGSRDFGKLELICCLLLLVSVLVWLIFKAPIISLCISLLAHFIGALPTYRKVWSKPRSESTLFWLYFFAASLLSIFASKGSTMAEIAFPIYFTLFDGSLFVLSMRDSQSR